MGVFVKGMYLPPNCYFCPMTNDGFYLCKANNPHKQLEDDCEERRPNWCPLIEVSEPHGRLGDLDELKTAFPCGESIRTESVRATIDHMPTIIPASEEVDESQRDYERAVEDQRYCEMYEPTYDPETGAM